MELKTLYLKRVKERSGIAKGLIRTNLYNDKGDMVGSYSPMHKQPHGSIKTIMFNCFKYKVVFIKDLKDIPKI